MKTDTYKTTAKSDKIKKALITAYATVIKAQKKSCLTGKSYLQDLPFTQD